MCSDCGHEKGSHYESFDGTRTGCAECVELYMGMVDAEPCSGFVEKE